MDSDNFDQYVERSEDVGIFYSITDIPKVARSRLDDYK